jgi:dihydrofolate synthase / folylpolyglutamate synthase
VLKAAQAAEAQVHFYAPAFEIAACDWEGNRMTLRHKKSGEACDFGLLGSAQPANATLVYEGLDLLRGRGWKINRGAAAAGFAAVKWPARFQALRAGPAFGGALFVLDGAHNAEAARAFAETWRRSPLAARPAAIVAGMLQDKERSGVLESLAPLADNFIFTRPASPRAADPCALADEMAALRPDAGIEVQQEPEAAMLAASRGGLAAVVGSFYLAGTALRLLGAERN